MKIILHIGMGKTGTSSIQLALSQNTEKLRSQNAQYLGMWFDMLDPAFRGLSNQGEFFRQSPDTMREQARVFCRMIRERAQAEGFETFIMSNESFSGCSRALTPFLEEVLKQDIQYHVIGYARNPRSWLPSAYVQWAIRDKANEGSIQDYDTKSRALVKWYNGLIDWSKSMGDCDRLDIRHYDLAEDIVLDFARASGVQLDLSDTRSYERLNDSEILLRAVFNNRFPNPTLPDLFDQAVKGDSKEYPTLETMISRYFDYSATDSIIEDNRHLFDYFRDHYGIDLLQKTANLPPTPQVEQLRNRLFDYLIEITLEQANRINHLEAKVMEIKALLK